MATINWVDPLSDARKLKEAELNAMCNKTINGRFPFEIDGTTYRFSNDSEAQDNFDKCARAFDKSLMTEIAWTAYDSNNQVVRIPINATLFEDMYVAHLNHIQGNISKFRDFLMPLVQAATTIEEIEAVTW